MDGNVISPALKMLPRLEKIFINCSGIVDISCLPENLKDLQIVNSKMEDSEFKDISRLTNLTNIKFNENNELTGEIFSHLTTLNKLKHLDLSNAKGLTGVNVELLMGLEQLQS